MLIPKVVCHTVKLLNAREIMKFDIISDNAKLIMNFTGQEFNSIDKYHCRYSHKNIHKNSGSYKDANYKERGAVTCVAFTILLCTLGKKHSRYYRQLGKGVEYFAKCLILVDTNYDSKIPYMFQCIRRET
jgi:hypothetical protein